MQPLNLKARYDVVIVGGGHNGLIAAAYLTRAGYSVLILERQAHVGGAAVSERIFAGQDARLSKYAYLVSLFPQKIIDDLGLRFQTRQRAAASFTPDGQSERALLISNTSPQQTEELFLRFTGSQDEYRAFQRFYHLTGILARKLWPTLLEPLRTRQEMTQCFTDDDSRLAWRMFVEQPLGEAVKSTFKDDLIRGLVFTDAKIGVLTHPHDPSLRQNRTFLYHIVGNGTGEWRVPVGGMGALTAELERCARTNGTEIAVCATVQQIVPGPRGLDVEFTDSEGQSHAVQAGFILANVAPPVLASMLPGTPADSEIDEGSVFKINMLLKRLPRVKSGYSPEQAFSGTFHIDEGYTAMVDSYNTALGGAIPVRPPGEMYCHSLTDPSVLSPELQAAGYQTLTLFGLDMPYRLFRENNAQVTKDVLQRYMAAINGCLAEPLEDCFALDKKGQPCIEARSPVDLEAELGLPAGNIFHSDLSWPFTDNAEADGSWGVETAYPNIFLCGSGAQRGGCVSGIPGHNAAMKTLACLQSR